MCVKLQITDSPSKLSVAIHDEVETQSETTPAKEETEDAKNSSSKMMKRIADVIERENSLHSIILTYSYTIFDGWGH